MIYTPLTNKAMRLAYEAHHGQVDTGGVPYIFHPYHLAEQMPDEISVCVALLHDVAEDTSITLEQLAEEFPPEVIEPLRLLTHDPSVDYFDYVRSVKSHPVARMVKLADLAHNADETRLIESPEISKRHSKHWEDKYLKAMLLLQDLSA